MASERCKRCGKRVPVIAFFGNLFLTFYKVVVGVLGGSPALVADGLHSFTDVIGTSVILASTRVSARPADSDHQYGHGKVEFMSSVFIYVVLVVLAIGIFTGGLLILLHGSMDPPHLVTFFGALISILQNVILFRLGQCAGRRNNSPALMANSFENRADAISSAAVCIGITLAITVHPACDPIAAMVVGVIIFVNCMVELRKALAGLMDKSLGPEVVERIREVAAAQKGVTGVGFVRTRPTGAGFWVDLEISVRDRTDMGKAEGIADRVRRALLARSRHFSDVEVYVAPQSSIG